MSATERAARARVASAALVSLGESVIAGVDDLQRILPSDAIDKTTEVTLLREGSHIRLPLTPAESSRQ